MKCSNCKKQISKADEFCPFCGAKQNRKQKLLIVASIAIGGVISVVLLAVFVPWLMKNVREHLGIDQQVMEANSGVEAVETPENTEKEEVVEESVELNENKILEYEISVNVECSSGDIAEDIKAQLYNNENGSLEVYTLIQGYNTLSLPAGSYTIRIETDSFEVFERSVEIPLAQDTEIEAILVPVQPTINTDNLVVDAVYEVFTNNNYTYEYAIPKIESELGDIPAINQKIYEEYYTNLVKKDLTNPNLPFPTVGEVSYKWYVNECVLSLAIKATLNDFGTSYDTYCIDLNDGHRITNEELLAIKNLDLRTYSEVLKSNLQTAYIDIYRSAVEQGRMTEEEYKTGLEATMLEENVERSQLLLNPNGELCATGIVFNEMFVFTYVMNMETCQLEEYDEWP